MLGAVEGFRALGLGYCPSRANQGILVIGWHSDSYPKAKLSLEAHSRPLSIGSSHCIT